MSDPIVLRPMVETDIPAVTAIYRESVLTQTATFEEIPPDETEMSKRWTNIRQHQLPWYVAMDTPSNLVLGYAYASPYRLRSAYRYFVEDSIYLAPSAVGKGLGGRLLSLVIQDVTAMGMRQILAVIGGANNLASIRLHKKMGFAEVGRLPDVGYKMGQWLDVILMQRALSVGASQPPEGTGLAI